MRNRTDTDAIVGRTVSTQSPGPHPPAAELTRQMEQVERTVWREIHRLATPAEAASHGLFVTDAEGFTALGAAAFDILYFNRVIGLGTDRPAGAAELDLLIDRYRSAGIARFFIHLSPVARPATLPDWLKERGFVHHNNYAKLYRDARDVPQTDSGFRIEPVEAADAMLFGRLSAPVFDWPPVVERMLVRTVGAPGWHHYIARDGDEPVACGAFRVVGPFAYLGPAATLPAWRGRGLQSALITRRLRDAAAAGCRWVVTETAEDTAERPAPSMRNMLRAGFRLACLRPNYLWSDPDVGP